MAELVRVSRDGATVVIKVSDDQFVTCSVLTSAGEAVGATEENTHTSLSDAMRGSTWRRPVKIDRNKFSDIVSVYSGEVVTAAAESTPSRQYRVPPTVRRSISDALEAYSSLLSDEDREIATRLATRTSVDKADIEWMHRFYANIEKAFALHGGKRGQAWAAKAIENAETSEAITASAFEYDPGMSYFGIGQDADSTAVEYLYAVRYDDEGELWDEDDVYVWAPNQGFQPIDVEAFDELDFPQVIELDEESARSLADYLDANAVVEDVAPETDPDETSELEGDDDVVAEDDKNDDLYYGENKPPKYTVAPYELQDINPLERNLFNLADSEMDWEFIDRLGSIVADATGYSPAERRQNAQRQPRASGGRFGGAPAPVSEKLSGGAFEKARLPEELDPVTDIGARIDEYLANAAGEDAVVVDEEPITAAGEDGEADEAVPVEIVDEEPAEEQPETDVTPLYLAVVDETDRTAVLDVISVVPDAEGAATAWIRSDGAWKSAPDMLENLRGTTPPVVVELSNDDLVKSVLAQVDEHDSAEGNDGDAYDDAEAKVASAAYELAAETKEGRERAAKKGYALPDGSFPISDESDLKKAVKAYGRAKDKPAAMRHIKKRARALNRTDLIPEDWKSNSLQELFDDSHLSPLYGPNGEIIARVVAAGVPGVADTPSDKASVERLYEYWTRGEGAAKIRWGTEGDLTRCHRHLTKYVGPDRAWGLCQNYHKRIFGVSNAKRDKAAGER